MVWRSAARTAAATASMPSASTAPAVPARPGIPRQHQHRRRPVGAGRRHRPRRAFVVAWVSDNQDGSGTGVYVQRFDAAGQRVGGELLVNTTIAGDQTAPAVAIADGGAFVVAWQSGDVDGQGIYAQRFDANGESVGGEILVNPTTRRPAAAPDVAMDAPAISSSSGRAGRRQGRHRRAPLRRRRQPAGGRVRRQRDDRRLAADCRRRDECIAASSSSPGRDRRPAAAPAPASTPSASTPPAGRRAPSSRSTRRSQATRSCADVAVNDSGDFVVVWQAADANSDGIYAQVFRADGSALGRERRGQHDDAGQPGGARGRHRRQRPLRVAWTGAAQDGNNTTGIASQWMQRGDEVVLSVGTGVDDAVVTLVGTLADINAMLDGIRFMPTAGFNGVASIRVAVDDLGQPAPAAA